MSAAIEVQTTVTQISAVAGTSNVIGAIADQITAPNFNLGNSTVVQNIATTAGVGANAVSAVTQVTSAANASIQTAANVTALAQNAEVAQGAATNALAQTNFNDPQSVSGLTGTYVANLATQVAAAPVGDVNGATIGTLGADVLTGGSGPDAIDGLDGNDQLNGAGGDDFLFGGAGYDTLIGGAGNDRLDGGSEIDRALYTDATGPIIVDMKAGTVTGDASVGTDTLISVEEIRGSSSDDTYKATGFTGGSPTGSFGPTSNEFEGMAGNDTITGNGSTIVAYLKAAAGVTVNLTNPIAGQGASGTAHSTVADDANIGTDTFTGGVFGIRGSEYDDVLVGSDNIGNVEIFQGRGGNDLIDGKGGFDRVLYWWRTDDNITGGISVNMAAGKVIGDASVGTDTLLSIEAIRATNFADTYDATGFSGSSTNAGSNGTFNEFEGLGGNDSITGNGNTKIDYVNANGGVFVDLASPAPGVTGSTGIAHGIAPNDLAGVGTDTIFGGVNNVQGSPFADTLYGSNNGTQNGESFDGGAGDDFIDGRGGFDLAYYNQATPPVTVSGINVTVTTYNPTNDPLVVNNAFKVVGDASIGTDTLVGVESVRGTNFDDTFNATGYNGANTGANPPTFNEFEGMGGNDTIIGNGLTGLAATRLTYQSASDGVTVDLDSPTNGVPGSTGIAHGTAPGDVANVGFDTIFGGVNRVRGSNFNDTISGNANDNILEGQGGNDVLNGRGGSDTLTGGPGSDTFVFDSAPLVPATITDFNAGQGDHLQVSATGFGNGLAAGATPTLIPGAPASVSNAGAGGYFIFDNTTHTLYWDATGGSGADAAPVVMLQGVASLLPSAFNVV